MNTKNNIVKYLYELNELENILDSLIFEDEVIPNIFDETNALELIESALYLMEDYMNENPTAISEPDFEEEFLEDIKELFHLQFEDDILENDWVEDDLNDLLEEAFKIFIGTFYPERSISNNIMLTEIELQDHGDKDNGKQLDKNEKNQIILDKIEHIKQKPQPTQRTDEWYNFRHNLITASNAYKAFESQSSINQLIYEKCQPLKKNDADNNANIDTTTRLTPMVNINTPFHWGQKYEPLSVMLYEHLYNTTVADFGCIKHDNYHFLGASPDGINVDVNSQRFGRMLEIKNIVNREINGIPKKEYWIQMQLQMEVCDLDECDFLETKFVEYESANEFFKELELELESQDTQLKTLDKKGVVIYFHNISEAKPFYVYKPLNIVKMEDILKWEEDAIELYQSPQHNMTYIKSNYWKLEKLSCVLVSRNKNWFKNNIQAIENVWNIIEKERITGYEHRAPNKKTKIKKEYIDDNIHSGLCLIKLQN